jgi:hypothetical protein
LSESAARESSAKSVRPASAGSGSTGDAIGIGTAATGITAGASWL